MIQYILNIVVHDRWILPNWNEKRISAFYLTPLLFPHVSFRMFSFGTCEREKGFRKEAIH